MIDILSHNRVTDVILIDDRHRNLLVVTRLIKKLGIAAIKLNIMKVDVGKANLTEVAIRVAGKVNMFGPATWKNKGLYFLSLMDRTSTEKVINEMDRLNLLKPHVKLFYIEDAWQQQPLELWQLVDAKYMFDLRNAILRREYNYQLEEILSDIVSKYVSDKDTVEEDEAFLAAAVDAAASAFTAESRPPIFRCPGDEGDAKTTNAFTTNILVSVIN